MNLHPLRLYDQSILRMLSSVMQLTSDPVGYHVHVSKGPNIAAHLLSEVGPHCLREMCIKVCLFNIDNVLFRTTNTPYCNPCYPIFSLFQFLDIHKFLYWLQDVFSQLQYKSQAHSQ